MIRNLKQMVERLLLSYIAGGIKKDPVSFNLLNFGSNNVLLKLVIKAHNRVEKFDIVANYA